jgi:hypothetical protein
MSGFINPSNYFSCGVTRTLQRLRQERAIIQMREVGVAVMMACSAQKDRPLGDWLMLFTGTILGGLIILLF